MSAGCGCAAHAGDAVGLADRSTAAMTGQADSHMQQGLATCSVLVYGGLLQVFLSISWYEGVTPAKKFR